MNRDNISKGISETFNVPVEQQKFVRDYSSNKSNSTYYEPNSGIYQPEKINGFNQNRNDMSQYALKNTFNNTTPILANQDFTYKNNTLYANLNTNLLAENIDEYRIDCDSSQRNIELYPNPFSYRLSFGEVVNSGLPSTTNLLSNKNSLFDFTVKDLVHFDDEDDNKIYSTNPNIIVKYEDKLKRIYNPQITRNFTNVKFIRIDNVVMPRFHTIIINNEWNYCNEKKDNKIKDDFDRYYNCVVSKFRYIPDVYACDSLFTDRFIMLKIDELTDYKKLGTSALDSVAYTLFSDKYISLFYYRCSVYYCARNYYDSELGNINRLTFSFYNSHQEPLTLDTLAINYEANFIKKTQLINPFHINFKDESLYNFYINRLTEFIKCAVLLNFNINKLIPYYSVGVDGLILNEKTFTVCDIYTELNEFVSVEKTFVKVNKINNKGQTVLISINDYIDNIIWFKPSIFKDTVEIRNNINILLLKYKKYFFNDLEKLKIEIYNIPENKFFQNHIQFVIGVCNNELNTKIAYHSN
jgi:hypothetical protein